MTPNNFLGLADEYSAFDAAGVLVLPIPFEATVSYGGGAADGPDAIIAASQQVELYDREFDHEPALGYGVHTLPPVALPADPAQAVDAIAAATAEAAASGKLVVRLGGEHTISAGFGRGRALAAHFFPHSGVILAVRGHKHFACLTVNAVHMTGL